jgi:hypothetical protein
MPAIDRGWLIRIDPSRASLAIEKKKKKDMHSCKLAILGFPCEFNLDSHLRHRLPNH